MDQPQLVAPSHGQVVDEAKTAAPSRDAADLAKSAEREKWRASLREANQHVWLHGPHGSGDNLDASLKRNSAFIKRLKQTNLADAKDALVKEVQLLSLTKYLDELIPSIPEILWKATTLKDRYAAIEILCALHARFGGSEFTEPLLKVMEQEIVPPPPKSQDASNEQAQKEAALVARQRSLLRGVTEMVLVGLVGPMTQSEGVCAPGLTWLYEQLRKMLSQDRDLVYTSVAQAILRSYGSLLLVPMETHEAGQPGVPMGKLAEDAVISEAQSLKFRKLFEAYYAMLARRAQREHERLQEQEQRNSDAYIRSGVVFDDRQSAFERRVSDVHTMIEAMHAMAASLQVELPELRESDKDPSAPRFGVNLEATSTLAEMSAKMEQEYASGKSPWEDEEMRKFYKDLCPLDELLPASVLEAAAASSDETDARVQQSLQHSLDRLPTMCNQGTVDDVAIELGFQLKSMSARRLSAALLHVPKHRWDMLPYYARLIATLQPYRPGLAEAVVEHLNQKLRQQQSFRKPDRQLQSHLIIYLGELTKFGLVPEHIVFHLYKVLLDDFSPTSIEMLALSIETCGRYLHRMPATAARMQHVLDLLRRKRLAHNLSEQHTLLLDNAYYKCVPPDRPIVTYREPSAMEQFITHVFTHMLGHGSFDRTQALVKMLNWSDESIRAHIFTLFTSPWLLTHDTLPLLARLLSRIQQCHEAFVCEVLDTLSEDIEADLLHLDFAGHQRRLARVRYLGECHACFLVKPDAMLQQLYRLCVPQPQRKDAPNDYTRVRMACTLLPYFGKAFQKPPYKQRLDHVCAVLQHYILSKDEPPVEVAYLLQDSFSHLGVSRDGRVNHKRLAKRLREAQPYLAKLDLGKRMAGKRPAHRDDGDNDDDNDDDHDDEEDDDDDDDDPERQAAQQAALDERAEADVEQELAMLMADTGGPSAAPSGMALEQTRSMLARAHVPRRRLEANDQHMVFSLVSRKQTQDIHVPTDASISMHARQQQAEAEAERQQLKAYVLAYREREES